MVKECETCSRLTDAPSRSKVSGTRAEVLSDIIFVDYGSVKNSSASARTSHHKKKDTDTSREEVSPSYDFLIVLDVHLRYSARYTRRCFRTTRITRFHASFASQAQANCG